MIDVNRFITVCRISSEPVLKVLSGGSCVLDFSIAVNNYAKTDDGKNEKVSFFDCVCYGALAEGIKPWLVKGKQVAIEARLQQQVWQDKQTGANRYKVVVVCSSVQPLGAMGECARNDTGFSPKEDAPQEYENTGINEDVPF